VFPSSSQSASLLAMAWAPIRSDSALASSSEAEFPEVSSFASRRPYFSRCVYAAAIGMLALTVCIAHVEMVGPKSADIVTGRMLLEDPELHGVVAGNILKVGQRHGLLGPDHHEEVLSQVAEGFGSIVSKPGNAELLGLMEFTEAEKAALLHMLGYLSDPRLQGIGLDVAHAVRDSSSDDPEAIKRSIAERLRPRLAEMSRLHQEAIPAVLRKFTDEGHGWKAILDPERRRISKSFNDAWDVRIFSAEGGGAVLSSVEEASRNHVNSKSGDIVKRLGFAEDTEKPRALKELDLVRANQAFGITTAVLEEARALLDILRSTSKMWKGKDLNMNPLLTSTIGGMDAIVGLVSCELDAALDHSSLQAMTCLLQEGTQGMDALREFFALVGLLGDNRPGNGRQGNHGNPAAGDGDFESPATRGIFGSSA